MDETLTQILRALVQSHEWRDAAELQIAQLRAQVAAQELELESLRNVLARLEPVA